MTTKLPFRLNITTKTREWKETFTFECVCCMQYIVNIEFINSLPTPANNKVSNGTANPKLTNIIYSCINEEVRMRINMANILERKACDNTTAMEW